MHRFPARPSLAARSTLAITPLVVLAVGALTAWGAWARRWMSDDGLIVLRTVRNLLAGNGPVFNAGERVEVNTSTAWQYLIYVGQRVSGARLEDVALALALVLSVAALMLATGASAGFYRATPVVPAGVLIYLALPPARDFMTSGLEWGLSIFYLAALWALLLKWVYRPDGTVALLLAFWAGLSWLIRPEFLIYGGVVGILLLVYCQRRLLVLAVALPAPLAYEIFRMGYYGLLYPNTAVAKSASGSEWALGLAYLKDFVFPYWLWLPAALLIVAAIVAVRDSFDSTMVLPLAVMEGCGLFHAFYVVRVGGDFMHGRMLLLPLFALLVPVFVLPLKSWITAAILAGIVLWAVVIAWRGNDSDWTGFDRPHGIVDEREYWTYATGREPGQPPLYAEQFRSAKSMKDFEQGIAGLEGGDAIAMRYLSSSHAKDFSWLTVSRDPTRQDPPTLYLVNAGLSSMNAPLNVRVLDNVGLTTPLASRQPRLDNARIGHDKQLDREWQVADSAALLNDLPPWVDENKASQARRALDTPELRELLATYRDPLDARRFFANIRWSLTQGRTLQLPSDPADYQ